MNCPKCQAEMGPVEFEGITVDRCRQCSGLWFDQFERERLKEIKGAESIDAGDAETGKEYNLVERINCPVCGAQMIRMVDLHQPHIWYESCPVCYGVFFDAGEFADYKHETLGDLFRRIGLKGRN